jgi:CRISPR-associated protein Cas1
LSHRIVEVMTKGIYLSSDRGFLVLESKEETIDKVPIEDIMTLILGQGQSVSTNLLHRLSDAGVTVAFCDEKYLPANMLFPISAHYQSTARLLLQIEASQPLKKRLWQTLVREKIMNQSRVLRRFKLPFEHLIMIANNVRSGDPENGEANAGRKYWSTLFAGDFRRDQDADGINALLNFGYAIVRSAVARAVVAVGLNPSLGVFHSNKNNPFCLVDDMMEPYRPFVDEAVKLMALRGILTPSKPVKAFLAAVLEVEVALKEQITTLRVAIQDGARSLVKSLEGGDELLEIPPFPEEGILNDVDFGV